MQIGGDQTIAQPNPMSSLTVEVHFDSSGYGSQTLNIYAVVDPDNSIGEKHKDNNTVWQ